MRRVTLLLSILFIALAGCDSGLVAPPADGELITARLPDDEVNDVLRDGGVDYSTFAAVELNVTVTSFDATGGARSADTDAPITVLVEDAEGAVLYAASVRDGDTASGELLVPTAASSVTLTLDSPQHEARSVSIEDPARYLLLDRSMAVQTGQDPDQADVDSDGDGIADCYDAFPDDPDLAFSRAIPSSDYITVAFEDNYPQLGDGDYNDFVARYRVVEYRSAGNRLARIDGVTEAVARGAGFDHEFGIVVSFAGTSAKAQVSYYNDAGELIGTAKPQGGESVRIVAFESTTDRAFRREDGQERMDNIDPNAPVSHGYKTTFTIAYQPTETRATGDVWAPYDPYLLVRNTDLGITPDIHLIGKEPLPDSTNPAGEDGFRDADGYPWALLVPSDWAWPRERTHIQSAYPEFNLWRESAGTQNADWYFTADPEHVVQLR